MPTDNAMDFTTEDKNCHTVSRGLTLKENSNQVLALWRIQKIYQDAPLSKTHFI
jgi:hypothetical protein